MLAKVTIRGIKCSALFRGDLLAFEGRSNRAVVEFGRVDPLKAYRNPVLIVYRLLACLTPNRGPVLKRGGDFRRRTSVRAKAKRTTVGSKLNLDGVGVGFAGRPELREVYRTC